MKESLKELLEKALAEARALQRLKAMQTPPIILEVPKHEAQGDFATTLPLSLAKIEKRPPREIASILVSLLEGRSNAVEKVEIAGPGYINFFLTKDYWRQTLFEIHRQKEQYGKSAAEAGKKVQIEFVSANPTGPLHVAHGRAAALGDALARLLEAVGYQVDREYYINDVGGQMILLGRSTYLRYRALFGETHTLPEEGYRGDYVVEIAKRLKAEAGDRYLEGPEASHLPFFIRYAYKAILSSIQDDLREFGVSFDRWFSEAEIYQEKEVGAALAFLKSRDMLYEKDGAQWVATMRFGDDKDRVAVRKNGRKTYFASDIAYHRNKLERGYDRLINIWGADHHGYIARMKAAVSAMGYRPGRLTVLLHQLVNLLRGGKPVKMSKRSGEFVTLRAVIDEVGIDATRFFFLMRRSDSSLDFDLELAKKASNENPVFYVQYAHARLCSIVRMAQARGWEVESVIRGVEMKDLTLLTHPEEAALIKQLALYPDLITSAAAALEPHRITAYLQTLAGMLHRYYFDCRVITGDEALTKARLFLITAVRIVLGNGLRLLGIGAPEQM